MKPVDINTARALQDLGYDGETTRWYSREGKLKPTHLVDDDIPAPRLDDAAYWIRDKHHIFAMPILDPIRDCEKSYGYKVCEWIDEMWYCTDYAVGFDYDSALEAAVTKAIEIIQQRQ